MAFEISCYSVCASEVRDQCYISTLPAAPPRASVLSQNPPLPLARYASKLLDTVCGVDPRNDATGGRGRPALSCESEAKARHAHARGQRGTVTYTMYPATASQEVVLPDVITRALEMCHRG